MMFLLVIAGDLPIRSVDPIYVDQIPLFVSDKNMLTGYY